MQKLILFLVAVGGVIQVTNATRFSPYGFFPVEHSFYCVDSDVEIKKLGVLLESVSTMSDEEVAELFAKTEWLKGFKSGRDILCSQIKARITAMKNWVPSPATSRSPTPTSAIFPSCG